MTIELYKNSSSSDTLGKTLTLVNTLNGNFLMPTSVTDPIVEVSSSLLFSIGVMDGDSLPIIDDEQIDITIDDVKGIDVNYAYIVDWNRYYFIRNVTYKANTLVVFSLHIDVLETYKSEILSHNAYISRNQYDYSDAIVDGLQSYSSLENIVYHNSTIASTSILNSTEDYSIIISTTNNYIISVDSKYGFESPLYPSREVNGYGYAKSPYVCPNNVVETYIKDKLLQYTSDIQYVEAFFKLPFNLQKYGYTLSYSNVLPIGTSTYQVHTDINEYVYDLNDYDVITPKIDSFKFSISQTYDKMTSRYYLYIPFVDYVEVDINLINNRQIDLYFVIDLRTGENNYLLVDKLLKKVLYTGVCNCVKQINLSNTDIQKYNERQQANAISTGLGTLSSLLAIAGGVATQNPIAIGGGAISLGSTIAKGIQGVVYDRPQGNIIKTNNPIGYILDYNIHLKEVRKVKTGDVDATIYGKPLNASRTLSNLNGATLISDIKLELPNATKDEYDEARALLKNIIYIN